MLTSAWEEDTQFVSQVLNETRVFWRDSGEILARFRRDSGKSQSSCRRPTKEPRLGLPASGTPEAGNRIPADVRILYCSDGMEAGRLSKPRGRFSRRQLARLRIEGLRSQSRCSFSLQRTRPLKARLCPFKSSRLIVCSRL